MERGPLSGAAAAIDPVTFEVIRHRLWQINDEQGRMAARLSGSTIVHEAFDMNASLLTADGSGLMCGVYVIHHGATIDVFVRRVLEEWPAREIREGDMFFTNDPWWGALHANDGILAMPVFWEGRIVAWSGIVMHDDDVGSPVPGSFVIGAGDRFGEAPLFPGIKMVEGFEPRVDVERAYLRNSRTPERNALNMRARVAALRATHGRIAELIARYGVATVLAAQDGILDHVERVVRARLVDVPDGSWVAHGHHDHDGRTGEIREIRCRLRKDAHGLRFDMSGTSAQAPGPVNCARPALEGAVLGALLTMLCHDLPWSTGALRRIAQVEVPEGTLVSARSPAPVSMASIMATLSAQDVAARAVAEMLLASPRLRGDALASWGPGICGATYAETGADGATSITTMSESFGGGGGARAGADGIDSGGVLHSMASRIANVEAHESRGRLLELWRREARDSAGAGRLRGGAGLEYAFTPHKSAGTVRLITRSAGVAVPGGRGLAGGYPGAPVSSVLLRGSDVRERFAAGAMPSARAQLRAAEEVVLEAKALTAIAEGDVVVSVTPGGGGLGDPRRRERASLAADVAAGLLSAELAGTLYGPGPPRGAVDGIEAAGAELRCGACGAALGPRDADQRTLGAPRERPLRDLGERFARCETDYVLRERACPACDALLGVDVQRRGEPPLEGARLRP